MIPIDETHNANLRSWVEAANDSNSDFPIQNLPFGVFSPRSSRSEPRIGVAIGDQILDLRACAEEGWIRGPLEEAAGAPVLNAMMALGRDASSELRKTVSGILRHDSASRSRAAECLVAMSDAEMLLPAEIGDYTDFYASIEHATNVGSMFRPDNPLLPNYKWIPIGYHGRVSSIVISGTPVVRPSGQTRNDATAPPVFGPTRRLDYELEVGAFIGRGNELGAPIPIESAGQHWFGLCLVNDWSARDVQAWEYQPLGPFLAKNFATTISPWVVTAEALAPFRVAPKPRDASDPQPLPHLWSDEDQRSGAIDLTLEVSLSTLEMRARGVAPAVLTRGSFRDMYWTLAQLIAHHASGGCNLRSGDLLASGTVSGTSKDSRGSMLELAWRGTEPIPLPTGETRSFLEDGDEVILRGFCERDGHVRIGFGECRGVVKGRTDS